MNTAPIAAIAVPNGFHDGDWVESKDQDPDGTIRLLQLADVGDGYFRNRSDRWINEETFEQLSCSPVLAGDILIARMPDPLGRACVVPGGLGSTITVVDVAVLRCDPQLADARFVAYAINAHSTRSHMESLQDGATRQRIPRKRLGRVHIPSPPVQEQRAIADYLDRETAQIDTLIDEQSKLIALLRERRIAIAAHLGDRVGVGDRMKWLLTEIDERAGDRYTQLPLMSVSISWGVRRRAEVTSEEFRAEDLSNYKACQPGHLLINRMRAFQGALGLAMDEGLVSPDYAVLRINEEIDAQWLAAVMKTTSFVGQMTQRVKGIGSTDLGNARTPRINISDIAEIRLNVPGREVQTSEVAELSRQVAKIDELIAETEHFIDLARERRSALIEAAVTGQIDVRGEVA